jgi:hypothetical protein
MQIAVSMFRSSVFARLAIAAFLLATFSIPALAQDVDHPINFSAGGGLTMPIYRTSSALNNGWNIDFRGGPSFKHFDADLDFTYINSSFNSTTLSSLDEPSGGVGIWSVTFNPMVQLGPRHGRLRPYLTGGYGIYHLNFSVAHPGAAPSGSCGWFDGCYSTVPGAGTVVAPSNLYKPGFNGGVGLDFPIRHSDIAFFGEARYDRMFNSNGPDIKYIPVTFGIRF